MLHSLSIADVLKRQLGMGGALTALGLKTVSFGDLQLVPHEEEALAQWLPALLIIVPRVAFIQHSSGDPRGPAEVHYAVVLTYMDRWEGNEVVERRKHEAVSRLVEALDRIDWHDRMVMSDERAYGLLKLKAVHVLNVNLDTRSILEYEDELIGRLTAAEIELQVRVLELRGQRTLRKA